jgi:hypothetical protein
METVLFDKNGEPLKVQFKVKNGVLAAAYYIKLAEKNSNNAVAVYEGDNQNPEDDVFYLPNPVNANEGRLLRFSADFKGLDLNLSKTYLIAFEIYQGNLLLKSVEAKGDLTSSAQRILLFAQLI